MLPSIIINFSILSFYFITICADDTFIVSGNKIMKNGEWIVFNGVSLECTEYFLRPTLGPLWGIEHCFGGPSKQVNGHWVLELNNEPGNVANILTNNFKTNPNIKKIQFKTPYDQVIDSDFPSHHPLVRLPTTGSTYLYDADCVTGNSSDYSETLDMIIQNLTSQGIAISYDYHWSCPQPSNLNCSIQGPGTMALREYGNGNPGALEYWDTVSKRYANNEYVFYELYNEPIFQANIEDFNIYYGGNKQFVGMVEMYNIIRKNDPNSIIIMAGSQSYAYNAATQIAFWLKYFEDYGEYPKNLIFNFHAYQGSHGANYAKALPAALRQILAAKLLAPVIFTEFGQYCCSGNNLTNCSNGATPQCTDHATGDNFSFNFINMAMQYDISWTAWSWLGSFPLDCNNLRQCLDLRNEDGSYVNNGTWGGAPWITIWDKYINATECMVMDTETNLDPNMEENIGYLPRPCIMGNYNMDSFCGYDLNSNILDINYTIFASDSMYHTVLPGIPPNGSCSLQGCPNHPCNASFACP